MEITNIDKINFNVDNQNQYNYSEEMSFAEILYLCDKLEDDLINELKIYQENMNKMLNNLEKLSA